MPETPRPWAVFNETAIVSPQGDAEVGTWLVADCRWKDDAALIVRAVNNYSRLREALREAADAINTASMWAELDGLPKRTKTMNEKCLAALAAAEDPA